MTSEYRKRVRKILGSELYSKNMITTINTFAVPVIRYTAACITWRQEDLKAVDIGTRKLLTMYGAFHPKSSTDRLYGDRKEGGRGLHSIERIVKEEEQSLKSYVRTKAPTDPLIAECQSMTNAWEVPNKIEEWRSKALHGAWHRGVSEVADMRKTYQWLHKINLKTNCEALIMAAQEQALNTRAIAAQVYNTGHDPRCRLCKEHNETVAHLVSGCSKLADNAYTYRHNEVAVTVYKAICSKYQLELPKDWRVTPDKVVQNNRAKVLWDFPIQTDIRLQHNRPDIILIDYEEKTGLIIDIAVPRDENIKEKEQEKIEKCIPLKAELERL